MAKTKTFEQFLKTYLDNQAIADPKESYTDWVKAKAKDPKTLFKEREDSIAVANLKSKSGYGKTAESLASSGLLRSGYADYINKRSDKIKLSSLNEAYTKYGSSEGESIRGYNEYIAARQKSDEEALLGSYESYSEVVSKLTDVGIVDFDSAYEYAISSGLSEKEAASAADTAVEVIKRGLKESVIKKALSERLSDGETYAFAMGIGLSEADARELAGYVKSMNNLVTPTDGSSYADYLKDKASK